jgi:2-C-methyl-D-erythritol 4-phosphate cytidylyltransferase
VTADDVSQTAWAAFVVLAGGVGSRTGADMNKAYLPLAGRPMVAWSFGWAMQVSEVGAFVLVARPEDEGMVATVRATLPGLPLEVVAGGQSRHRSEHAAMEHLAPRCGGGGIEVIAVHDAARPLAGHELLLRVLQAARRHGGAVPVLPAGDVLPIEDGAWPPGAALARVQTPQAFRADGLLAAFRAAERDGFEGTDTAASVQRYHTLGIRAVPGDRGNLKVTYRPDIEAATRLLSRSRPPGGA